MSTSSTLTRPDQAPAAEHDHLPSGVVASVARAHARQTLRNPMIWLSTLLSGGVLAMLVRDASGLPELARFSTFIGLGSAPLAAAALLVAHNNVSRPRRDGTEPLFDSLAAQPARRTLGQLFGALSALLPALALAIGWAGALAGTGTTGSLNVPELAVGPLVVGLASVVGVAAATWAPQRFAGLAALGVFAAIQVGLHDTARGTVHWLGWWQTVTWHTGADLWIRPSWLHLAYLAVIASVLSVFALVRHGLTPRRAIAGVVAVSLAATAGIAQLPYPSDEQIAAVWDRIENPADHWDCQQVEATQVCLFPLYTGWRDGLADVVNATLEPVPPEARPAITVVQRHHGFPSQIMNEFGYAHPRYDELSARGHRALDEHSRIPSEGPIRIDVSRWAVRHNHDLDVALAAAARAVGLPAGPVTRQVEVDEAFYQGLRTNHGPEGQPGDVPGAVELEGGGAIVPVTRPCRPDGQAREVVAIWLAARSSPGRAELVAAAGRALVKVSDDTTLMTDDGEQLPAPPYVGNHLMLQDGTVEWTPEGVYLASQMLDRADVADTITGQWARWTDPTTPSSDLVATFGLQPYPSAAQLFRDTGLDPADHPAYVAAWPDRPDQTAYDQPITCG